MTVCKICEKEYNTLRGFQNHLAKFHLMSKADYYLQFFEKPKECPYCGSPLKFKNLVVGYYQTCGNRKCVTALVQDNNFKKYGVRNVSSLKGVQEKKEAKKLKNFGDKNYNNMAKNKATKKDRYDDENYNNMEKNQKTKEERYGDEGYNNRAKSKQTVMERYGVENVAQLESVQDKIKATNNERRGADYGLQTKEVWDKIDKAVMAKYGVKNVSQAESVKEKTKKVFLEKYGFTSAAMHPDVTKKGFETKRRNNSFHTSKPEKELQEFFIAEYGKSDVEFQYSSEEYPHPCDFYIKSLNLYLELQGTWTHGRGSYVPSRKEDQQKVDFWTEKAKTSNYYKGALSVWTKSDPKKRLTAKENSLNFLEVFNTTDILTQIERQQNGLKVEFSSLLLEEELDKLKVSKGDYNRIPNQNKIILSYHKFFFEKENELYKTDPIKRRKLIENRIKYLDKKENELTDLDLLMGFKRSGIHYGYSHFSPYWIKAFIEEYSVESIYDPFGGWSQRMLGSLSLNKYIYNDLNVKTFEATKQIVQDFDIKNVVCYNEDAETFAPKEVYEAVFTCPPFYNLEDYGLNTDYNYGEWIHIWWRKVVKNALGKAKIFAFVINEPLLEDMKGVCLEFGLKLVKETIIGPTNKSHLNDLPHPHMLLVFEI